MEEIFYPGQMHPMGSLWDCFSECFDTMLLPQSYWYPNLSEGADSIGGHMHGDKEYPFSGITIKAEFGGRVCKARLGVYAGPSDCFSVLISY